MAKQDGASGDNRLVRLDRLLSNRGYGSRKEVGLLLYRNQVQVNGEYPKSLADKVKPSTVTVDGLALDPESICLLLNKPLGYTCSHKDGGELVYDLLPPRFLLRNPQVQTVGRLDKDTTGALLFTDDGTLLHRLIAPKRHHAKVYEVELATPLEERFIPILQDGSLLLEGESKPLLPAELELLTPTSVRLTIYEGRYHQVKRMFKAAENEVVSLHRSSFAGLSVEGLELGSYKLLDAASVQALANN